MEIGIIVAIIGLITTALFIALIPTIISWMEWYKYQLQKNKYLHGLDLRGPMFVPDVVKIGKYFVTIETLKRKK